MSDHRSVQETEVAAAGKVGEGLEALRRLIFQERREKERKPGKAEQKNPDLESDFYRAYRENGVDETAASAAARDAALGLGAIDSPAIAKAEAQAVDRAQEQAKEYREVTQAAANPETSEAERQQAATRRTEIEQNLGIHNQPREVKTQTIAGLDPQTAQNQQADTQPLSTQRKTLSAEQKVLKADYQKKLEKGGVSTLTAEPASYDLANGKGAKDSQYVATAQQELQQHQLLKSMYQSVYEKHRVPSEVAAKAADQLARGNGANRSPEVREAHKLALANLRYSQQISSAQNTRPGQSSENTSKQPAAAPSASGKLESQPKVNQQTREHTFQQKTTADEIWAKFSPGKNGVFETMARSNPAMQRMSDQSVARDALLSGYTPVDVQKAIAQNSSHAQTLEYPRDYARTIVQKAEASPEMKEKRAMALREGQSTDKGERLSRKATRQKQANHTGEPTRKGKSRKKVKAQDRGMSY